MLDFFCLWDTVLIWIEQLRGYKKCRLQKTPANYKTHRQSSTSHRFLHHTTPPQYISTVKHNQTENVIVETNKSIKNNNILKLRDWSPTQKLHAKTPRISTQRKQTLKLHFDAAQQHSLHPAGGDCGWSAKIPNWFIISYRYIDHSIWPDDLTNQRM